MRRLVRDKTWLVEEDVFRLAKRVVNDAPDNCAGLRNLDKTQRAMWVTVYHVTAKWSAGRQALAALEMFPAEQSVLLDIRREHWLNVHQNTFFSHRAAELWACDHPFYLASHLWRMDDRVECWPEQWGDISSVPILNPDIEKDGEKAIVNHSGTRVWKLGYQIVSLEDGSVACAKLGLKHAEPLLQPITWSMGKWLGAMDIAKEMAMTLVKFVCLGQNCQRLDISFNPQMGYMVVCWRSLHVEWTSN